MLQKKKVSFSLLFCLLQFVVFAQDTAPLIWSRDFNVNNFPDFDANDNIGIKSSGILEPGENVFLNVYVDEIYDPLNENISFLYGLKAPTFTNGEFVNIPYQRQESRRKFWSDFKTFLEFDTILYYVRDFPSNSIFVLRRNLMALLKNHIASWADEPPHKKPKIEGQSASQSTVHVTIQGSADQLSNSNLQLSLNGLGLPRIINGNTFDPNFPDLQVFVYRNGIQVGLANDFRLNPQPGQPANPQLNLLLGDSVVFRSKHLRHEIQDLPEVWIARSSGESKYYCTKNIRLITKKGDIVEEEILPPFRKPFIGFDFNGNGIITRNREPGRTRKFTPFEPSILSEGGLHEFFWIAQRRMDVNVSDFSDNTNVSFDLAKSKAMIDAVTYNDADKQKTEFNFSYVNKFLPPNVDTAPKELLKMRNNKREGFNRKVLFDLASHMFHKAIQTGPDYKVQYNFLGSVYDFLLKGSAASDFPWGVKYDYWKGTHPEVQESFHSDLVALNHLLEQRYNKGEEWSTIDLFVSLYVFESLNRNNNLRYISESGESVVDYQGYEIQDKHTYKAYGVASKACNGKPCVRYDATGGGAYENVKAPGKITFRYKNSFNDTHEIPIKLNITSPFDDKGFYGSLEGEQWPAQGGTEVSYTFTGLEGINDDVKNRLVMVYSYENELGLLGYAKRPFNQTNYDYENGRWTEKFNIGGAGYSEVTVYYKTSNTPNAAKVIIAGKELLPIKLRHVSVPGSRASFATSTGILAGLDLMEGKGEASNTYLTDLVKEAEIEGLDSEYYKHYTFSQGDRTTFVAMDGAPHTFFHYDTDWELSERTLAKRMNTQDLMERISWDIETYNIKDIRTYEDPLGVGHIIDHTWENPGLFVISLWYETDPFNNRGNLIKMDPFSVKVIQDPFQDTNESTKGNITLRALTDLQRTQLEEKYPTVTLSDNIKVAKVENVFSVFKAKANVDYPLVDLDFDYKYYWKVDGDDKPESLPGYRDLNTPTPKVFVRSYEDHHFSFSDDIENTESMNTFFKGCSLTEYNQYRFPSEKNVYYYDKDNGAYGLLDKKYRIKPNAILSYGYWAKMILRDSRKTFFFGENLGLLKYKNFLNHKSNVFKAAFPPNYNPKLALFLNGFSSGKTVLFDPMTMNGKELSVYVNPPSGEAFVAEFKGEAPENPLVHLEFENNLEDTSGNNVTVTSSQGTINYNQIYAKQKHNCGKIVDEKININIEGLPSVSDFRRATIAFWIRIDDVSLNQTILEHLKDTKGIMLGLIDEKLVATMRTTNEVLGTIQSECFLNNQTFYHIALVLDMERNEFIADYPDPFLKMYINGTQVGQLLSDEVFEEGEMFFSKDAMTSIGGLSLLLNTDPFKGYIDDYYMYDKALSLTEINQLIMSAVPDVIAGGQHKSNTKTGLEKGVEPVVLYPNPTAKNKALTLETHLEKAETITYSITDISGKTVVSKSIAISAGTTKTLIKVSGLKAGVYIVKIIGNQLNSRHKIVIE